MLEVNDLPGGVRANAVEHIFDSAYTTGEGAGLGLYPSR